MGLAPPTCPLQSAFWSQSRSSRPVVDDLSAKSLGLLDRSVLTLAYGIWGSLPKRRSRTGPKNAHKLTLRTNSGKIDSKHVPKSIQVSKSRPPTVLYMPISSRRSCPQNDRKTKTKAYTTENGDGHDNTKLTKPRGKILGSSSAPNKTQDALKQQNPNQVIFPTILM